MSDQANTLRLMAAAARQSPDAPPRPPHSAVARREESPAGVYARTIAVTGGKGGVGKSNVAVNVSLELAARGRRVTLLDADLALANADVLLGLTPAHHLGHVLSGQRALEEVIIETEGGVRLIPGGSGVEELANLRGDQHARLVQELRAMEQASDYLLIDTPAGVGGNVTGVLRAASEIILVTTPEPTAVVDAYATLKVIHRHTPTKPVWVVINDVVGVGDAERTFAQLSAAAGRFLGRSVGHLGTIPRDPELSEAVREQMPVVEYAPKTPASRALRLIAKDLDTGLRQPSPNTGRPVESFWQALAITAE